MAKTSFGVIDANWLDLEAVAGRDKDTLSLGHNTLVKEQAVVVFSQVFDKTETLLKKKN